MKLLPLQSLLFLYFTRSADFKKVPLLITQNSHSGSSGTLWQDLVALQTVTRGNQILGSYALDIRLQRFYLEVYSQKEGNI